MRQFCEEEGYDYDKFMRYSRKGQKELLVVKFWTRGKSS